MLIVLFYCYAEFHSVKCLFLIARLSVTFHNSYTECHIFIVMQNVAFLLLELTFHNSYTECHYAECHIFIVIQNVAFLLLC